MYNDIQFALHVTFSSFGTKGFQCIMTLNLPSSTLSSLLDSYHIKYQPVRQTPSIHHDILHLEQS
jgi:hypothetical protein